jgi:hypothetical protein
MRYLVIAVCTKVAVRMGQVALAGKTSVLKQLLRIVTASKERNTMESEVQSSTPSRSASVLTDCPTSHLSEALATASMAFSLEMRCTLTLLSQMRRVIDFDNRGC